MMHCLQLNLAVDLAIYDVERLVLGKTRSDDHVLIKS